MKTKYQKRKLFSTQKRFEMEFGQLHHVEYYVNDLESTKEFWGWFLGHLGYSVYQSWDDGISYTHKTQTYLCFVKVEKKHSTHINNRHAQGLNHIAFQGSDQAFLTSMAEKLRARGIKILTLKDGVLCFEDPNGFAVEIFW